MAPDRRASPNGMERFVSSVSAADGIRAISGKSGGTESTTEHTERPEAVTEHTERVGCRGEIKTGLVVVVKTGLFL